jgi:hypothetical protein
MSIPIVRWNGCYDQGWRDLIVPEAFCHPAKMARGLVARIFDELLSSGALQKGDLVCDPFGGIGTTSIEAAARGVRSIACELESRFYRLAAGYDCPGYTKATWRRYSHRWTRNRAHADLCPTCQAAPKLGAQRVIPWQEPHHFVGNFELHRRDWEAMARPLPVMVQGDSRQLRQHVGPVFAELVLWPFHERAKQGNNGVTALVSSPPYAGAKGHPSLGDETVYFMVKPE